MKNHKVKHTLLSVLGAVVLTSVMYSCANMGHPSGGPIDEAPPHFLKSTPEQGALNNKKTKILIEVDEFIKLDNASEKVVVSPPQVLAPEIKAIGKKVSVNLLDSLKAKTTYTVDFSDVIQDNNEGNPLGNYTFTFSTGSAIDTMEVAGTLLEASNLEPIKGMLVGLHSNLADSAFNKLPLDRVGRTDSKGHFSIKGIAPGTYRLYALQDANQNFAFDQKSEAIAFAENLVIPRFEQRTRQDTIWRDTVTVDTIVTKQYTHYLPDDLILRSFKEDFYSQYLIKSERLQQNKFSFYFAAISKNLPIIKGLNFNEKDAFILEKSAKNDTLHYWVKDSAIYKMDTLAMSVDYLYTDTLGKLVPKTDTLNLSLKKTKSMFQKKKKDNDKPEPMAFLKVNVSAPSLMDVYSNIHLDFEEPLAHYDSTAIHLKQKVDSVWKDVPFVLKKDTLHLRSYDVLCEWKPQGEYQFTTDSMAFHGFYGLFSDKIKQEFKIRSLDEYGKLYLNITGADSVAFVELLDTQDKVLRKVQVNGGQADFHYLNPAKYYVRLINDTNGNGIWDTGNYELKRQPEMVFYCPQVLEIKALWEVEQDWNVNAVPLNKQKADSLKKQKPDEDKKKKKNQQNNQNNRNNSSTRY